MLRLATLAAACLVGVAFGRADRGFGDPVRRLEDRQRLDRRGTLLVNTRPSEPLTRAATRHATGARPEGVAAQEEDPRDAEIRTLRAAVERRDQLRRLLEARLVEAVERQWAAERDLAEARRQLAEARGEIERLSKAKASEGKNADAEPGRQESR